MDSHRGYCAYIATDQGTLAIRLRPTAAPHAVNSFVQLARQGYFDGTTVTRSCPDSADPGCFGQVGEVAAEPPVDYRLPKETVQGQCLLGAVAMSADGDSVSGGRFFISTGDNRALPRNYTLFGQVTDGFEVLPALHKGLAIHWIAVIEAAGTTT